MLKNTTTRKGEYYLNIKSKIVSFLFVFIMALGFMPGTSVQASVKDINIISNTEVTSNDAKNGQKQKGQLKNF